MFEPNRAKLTEMMPLALAMCLNVVLPNLSLAFSTVAFYQIVRALLTPTVAAINFFCYGTIIPRQGLYSLIPVCLGVGIVTYYDTRRGTADSVDTTTAAGVFFAFSGVLASSLYTVWLSVFQKRFNMNSFQLLFNQAPMSAFLLLYVIPFTDRWPVWGDVASYRYWLLGLVSHCFAVGPSNTDSQCRAVYSRR
jgi:solute carrier family 35, member E3